MHTITNTFSLLWEALFFQSPAYVSIRDDKKPVTKGLVMLIILGVAVAIAGFIGTTLNWASSPSLNGIQEAILRGYQNMPWWQFVERDPQAMNIFQQVWDQVWKVMGYIIPSPASSLAGILFQPLGLIISWLIFGLLAHLFARMLGGTGSLNQTLGTTSLAAAPQLLLLLTVFPGLAAAGIGTWVLLCRYFALRITHNLSWARAIWATILPGIFLFFLGILLALIFAILFGSIIAQAIQGGLLK